MRTGWLPSLRRQRYAHDLLVVPRIDAAIGERRVRPDDLPAAPILRRIEQVRSADFFVAFRRETGQDQVAQIVAQEKAVGVRHEEGVRRQGWLAAGGGQGLPDPLAGVGLQAAQFPHAAYAVDVAVLDDWGTHDGVQGLSEFAGAGALFVPRYFGDGTI